MYADDLGAIDPDTQRIPLSFPGGSVAITDYVRNALTSCGYPGASPPTLHSATVIHLGSPYNVVCAVRLSSSCHSTEVLIWLLSAQRTVRTSCLNDVFGLQQQARRP
jgi:hypothetical protein